MSQEREEALSQLYANLCSQLGDAILNLEAYSKKVEEIKKKIAEIEAAKVVCKITDQMSKKASKNDA